MPDKRQIAREAVKAAKIQTRADEWQAIVEKHFNYLESKYGFRITQVDASSVWTTRVIYQNATTAIYVDCSYEYIRAEVSLVRLVDGILPAYPVFIRCDTVLHETLLDGLLCVRARHVQTELEAVTGLGEEQIEASLSLMAHALEEYATDILLGDFSIFATLEAIVKKRVQDGYKRKQEAQNLPNPLQYYFIEITRYTDSFSEDYLNKEYADLCSKLTAELCQQELSPLLKSKSPTWACAIIHALSLVNNLFDTSQPLHIQPEQIAGYFELSPSTMLTKSRQIRTLPGIHLQDPAWIISTESNNHL